MAQDAGSIVKKPVVKAAFKPEEIEGIFGGQVTFFAVGKVRKQSDIAFGIKV